MKRRWTIPPNNPNWSATRFPSHAIPNPSKAQTPQVQFEQPQNIQTVWLGARTGGLQWLTAQIASELGGDFSQNINILHPQSFTQTYAEQLSELGVQRLIVGLGSRTDIPLETLGKIVDWAGDIPVAFAVDSWFDGSRRTGWGETLFPQMAWYRWWDGWRPWLRGELTELFGPCVPAAQHLTMPTKLDFSFAPNLRGAVVADCAQTAQGWCDVAQAAGLQCQTFSSRSFGDSKPTSTPEHTVAPNLDLLHWLLVDDTADLADTNSPLGPIEICQKHQANNPDCVVLFASCLPRADLWTQLAAIYRCEPICKPSTGANLLSPLQYYYPG